MTAASPTRSLFRRSRPFVVAAVLAGALTAPAAASAQPEVYWGAYISGQTYDRLDAPFDAGTIDTFEANAGKRASIVHWGQPWFWGSQGGYQSFQAEMAERVRARGSIPMISWGSWDLDKSGELQQPDFRLQRITQGHHDDFLRQWARDVRDWGHPLFIRFNWEMNGHWYPWSERVNGNAPGQFAAMWRHVVRIFREEGATNATWVWAPNHIYEGDIPLAGLYPGGGHTDWVGISGYNWGADPVDRRNSWRSFETVHKVTYDALGTVARGKPVMIAETASSELGGSKAAWINNALKNNVPAWRRVKAVVWFNWNTERTRGIHWVIESSSSAQAAFRSSINSPLYASADFAALPRMAKVPPLAPWPAPPDATGSAGVPGPGRSLGTGPTRVARLTGPRRCRAARRGCLRVTFRTPAGPNKRLRYWIRVREERGGRTISRRVGRTLAGRRRSVVLRIGHRPRCGRVAVRVTMRAAGRPPVVVTGRGVVRRMCHSPRRTPARR